MIAAAITSQTGKAKLADTYRPSRGPQLRPEPGFGGPAGQVRTLDKKRLREKMGHVEENVMEKVDLAIAVSFGLPHDQMV